MDIKKLVQLAIEARSNCYAPYSNFGVGAALLAESGKIYLGCNVENASYGASICAERNAALQAVLGGDRKFKAIAVIGYTIDSQSNMIGYSYPCGICRQFLNEFAAPDMKVFVARTPDDILEFSLDELLPNAFGPQSLPNKL